MPLFFNYQDQVRFTNLRKISGMETMRSKYNIILLFFCLSTFFTIHKCCTRSKRILINSSSSPLIFIINFIRLTILYSSEFCCVRDRKRPVRTHMYESVWIRTSLCTVHFRQTWKKNTEFILHFIWSVRFGRFRTDKIFNCSVFDFLPFDY